VDVQSVRAAFDAQVRRRTEPDEPGTVIEADDGVLRWIAAGGQTSRIEWSGLSAETADAAIAAQARYFTARGTPVEWKLYDYDQPPDLGQRLLAAGFVPGEDELMLVAETAAVGASVVLPDGVRIVPVRDETRLQDLLSVHDLAFGTVAGPDLGERLLAQLRTESGLIEMVVAMAGDEPVAAARAEFPSGTDFAGLWGAGTIPGWRGRGLFRALVAYRAGLAAARGYRYLQVDTSVMSRPILRRLGFESVAVTTPYVLQPGRRAGQAHRRRPSAGRGRPAQGGEPPHGQAGADATMERW
jgi:GNAT superfamily N-acetyltransferase